MGRNDKLPSAARL